MRRKLRYLAFETTDYERNISQIVTSISKKLGVGRDEIRIILQRNDASRGLLRCGHLLVGELKKTIADEESSLKVLGVSGTIRAARRKFFPQRQKIE
jgi:RNase P/RNase MRP subunit POP5